MFGHRLPRLVLLLFVLSTILILAVTLPVLGKKDSNNQTDPILNPTIIYGSSASSPRLLELNRVLGIPMEDLQKLSAEEVKNLYINNADKLGVQVYQNTVDENGQEVPVLIAGDRVFKAEPANSDSIVPTPTQQTYP